MAQGRRSFSGRADQIPAARRFVTAAIPPGSSIRDTVALLVSEAATNALLHTASGQDNATFEVRFTTGDASVRVEVSDGGGPERPHRRVHEPESMTGRGLELFDELSSRWGVTERSDGRTVWFELDARPGVAG